MQYGLSAKEVGDALRRASDELGRNKTVLAFYLFDMEERRLYQVSGHASTVHFGEAQLDMEPRRTREYVQVGRALQHLELVDNAFEELGWSKVTALLPVVQRDTQREWVEFAKGHSFRELREEVGGCRAGDLPGEGGDYGLVRKRVTVTARLEDAHYAMFEEARVRFSESAEDLLSDEELIVELLRRAMHGDAPKEPRPEVEPNVEELSEPTRQEVLRRDHHRCRNCQQPFDLHVHHIVFRQFGGSNAPPNLITLCANCHALVHRGFLVIGPDRSFRSASGRPIIRGVRTPGSPQPPPG